MSSTSRAPQIGRASRAPISIPQFEPLPPTNILNRIINKVLAPLFYLLFSIVTAVIVVPIYTVIENFKHGRNSKGGQRFASNQNPSKTQRPSQAKDFLSTYSSSYVAKDGTVRQKDVPGSTPHHHHHHHHHDQNQGGDKTI